MIERQPIIQRNPIIVPRVFQPTVKNPYGYIYITTNLINHRKYVGRHKYLGSEGNYKGSGTALQNAFSFYGKYNFISEPIDWAEDKDTLNDKELWWIEFLGCVEDEIYYNIARGGEGWTSEEIAGEKHPFYGHRHTQETKEQIRQSKLGKHYGWKHTEEHKNNMSKLMKGRKFSDETRRKMSENHADFSGERNPMYGTHRTGSENPNSKPIVQLTLSGEFVQQYAYIRQASINGRTYISKCCKGKREQWNGYKWMYLEDYLSLESERSESM